MSGGAIALAQGLNVASRTLSVAPAVVLAAGVLALVLDSLGRSRTAMWSLGGALFAAAVTSAAAAAHATMPDAPGVVEIVRGVAGGGGFAGAASAVYWVAGLAVITGLREVPEGRRVAVAALIALAAVSCQALIGAHDVLVAVIALEMIAIAAFAMVASAGGRRSDEAAMRYFVQGSVAAGLLMFGLASTAGLSGGSTLYRELGPEMAALPGYASSVIGMLWLTALAFKAGAFPFHSWVPDAYQVAPPSVAVFLAGAPKIAAVSAACVLFARSVWSGDAYASIQVAIAVAAALSIVYGNLAALRQENLGRMLGYSAIAQAGYALVGVASGSIGTVPLIVAYALAVAVAFGGVSALSAGGIEGVTLRSLSGVAARRPLLAALVSISMLSLTGIPLTAGFVGKLWVFYEALTGGWVWLVVVAALGSVVSFGYYGRVIGAMYFGDAPDEALATEPAVEAPSRSSEIRPRLWPFALTAALLVAGGVAPLVTGFAWLLRALGV